MSVGNRPDKFVVQIEHIDGDGQSDLLIRRTISASKPDACAAAVSEVLHSVTNEAYEVIIRKKEPIKQPLIVGPDAPFFQPPPPVPPAPRKRKD